MHTTQIADRIARYAAQIGYHVRRDGAAESASRYVECTRATDDDAGETLKIRVSDHDPKYEYDLDVHINAPRWTSIDWFRAVAILAERAGQPVPPVVRAQITLATRHAGALAASLAAETDRARAAMAAAAARDAAVAAAYPAEWAAAQTRDGAGRRERQRLLRRRYEREHA